MSFDNAVENLRDGYAAKRPSWGGYVKKVVTDADDGAYKLTFKNRAGTEYEYTYNGTAWTAPATTVPFDTEMLEAMLADDWQTGTTAAFESARSGSGTW